VEILQGWENSLTVPNIVSDDGTVDFAAQGEQRLAAQKSLGQPMLNTLKISGLQDIKDFYDYAKNNKTNSEVFVTTTASGTRLGVPELQIRHDIKKHNSTREEWDNVLNNIENIERLAVSGENNSFGNRHLLLKVNTPNGVYGVTISLSGEHNDIETIFKSTGKNGVDAWLNKAASKRPELNSPVESRISGVTPSLPPLKDIISQARKNLGQNRRGQNRPQQSGDTAGLGEWLDRAEYRAAGKRNRRAI
jgi:hypothetical protein